VARLDTRRRIVEKMKITKTSNQRDGRRTINLVITTKIEMKNTTKTINNSKIQILCAGNVTNRDMFNLTVQETIQAKKKNGCI
jgi:hypothetical protein